MPKNGDQSYQSYMAGFGCLFAPKLYQESCTDRHYWWLGSKLPMGKVFYVKGNSAENMRGSCGEYGILGGLLRCFGYED